VVARLLSYSFYDVDSTELCINQRPRRTAEVLATAAPFPPPQLPSAQPLDVEDRGGTDFRHPAAADRA
jgi:hypothetical protein